MWKLKVGRYTLLQADRDVAGNSEDGHALTTRLYDGNDRTRIRQELLLGIGVREKGFRGRSDTTHPIRIDVESLRHI